jgi:ABC-type phosphate/phosphonate transport system substrate-binding protein
MLATLPMYDFPEVRPATEAFWQAIAGRLGASVSLSQPEDWTAGWRRPDLLFSQTCGYPFTHEFAGKLKLVATPQYAAPDCDGPFYCSILLAREPRPLTEFRGKIAAFNNPDSMSGMLALKLMFAPFAEDGRFFARAVETGGHLASLSALQKGEADVAAIDCVTVAYARLYHPQALAGLVEVARSPRVPGLPFVTIAGDIAKLRQALTDVFADESLREIREALLLDGFSLLTEADYAVIPRLETEMEAAGGLFLPQSTDWRLP